MARMRLFSCLFAICLTSSAFAQWTSQDAHTKVNFYAVHAPSTDLAWASGGNGTVVRTLDGGHAWQACTVPPDTAHTDLRGVQAIDATTAVVMTSGKGERSRLYRTSDGCQTWKLVFTNPEESSSFVSMRRVTSKQIYVLGEPFDGKFQMYLSQDAGATWFLTDDPGLDADKGESAAASTLLAQGPFVYFGTAGGASPYVHYTYPKCESPAPDAACTVAWARSVVPIAGGNGSGGISSVAARMETSMSGKSRTFAVAIGGTAADPATGAAAVSPDGGQHWSASQAPLHGYRSAIGYDPLARTWIAVGPSGTDLSTDDAKTWHAPSASAEQKSADTGWNALSLPFAVGADGKIARWNANTSRQ